MFSQGAGTCTLEDSHLHCDKFLTENASTVPHAPLPPSFTIGVNRMGMSLHSSPPPAERPSVLTSLGSVNGGCWALSPPATMRLKVKAFPKTDDDEGDDDNDED